MTAQINVSLSYKYIAVSTCYFCMIFAFQIFDMVDLSAVLQIRLTRTVRRYSTNSASMT